MKKRFLILGAGAIGSYLGGSLALDGHEVTFLEREKDIPSLEMQGIIMEIEGEGYATSTPRFSSSLDQVLSQGCDLIISAVKTYHLDSILTDLVSYQGPLPPLLCLQNGVDSEERISAAIGSNLVIPGTVTSAVDCPRKGKIIVSKLRGMGVAGSHSLAGSLIPLFQQAGIQCVYYRHPADMKWSKLITNLLGNASSAILNMSPAQIYANRSLYRLEMDQIREALKVMEIQGIKPVNLPGVPVKLLAAICSYLPAWLSQPFLSRLIGGGRGEKMPSFHLDLYSGKGKSEVEQLNGAVVRAGKKYQLPTPVNSFLLNTLLSLISGDLSLDTYSGKPEEFLQQLISCLEG